MKASLDIKIGQRLAMTPQLQQAVKLLQMSTLDLQSEIQQALEENPLLCEVEYETRPEDEPSGVDRKESANDLPGDERASDGLSESFAGEIDTPRTDDRLNGEELTGHTVLDSDFDSQYDPPVAPMVKNQSFDDGLDSAARRPQPVTLYEHLMAQVGALHFSPLDRHIANALVLCIADTGYLTTSTEDVADFVNDELGLKTIEPEPLTEADPSVVDAVSIDDVRVVLRQIQNLEPTGVGARSLTECLLLQLEKETDHPACKNAARIVESHLADLAGKEFEKILKRLGITEEELSDATELIQTLDARPGNQIATEVADYIVPDVTVRRSKKGWIAHLNNDHLPRLSVNKVYADLIERGKNTEQNEYLKNHVNDAKWFIKSLHSRHDTLHRVANEIVANQQEFFDQGDEAMKPMILADIANKLELHESTVSRATSQKYMLTPRGVYELKHFFSTRVGDDSGDGHSATAIRSMIKKIIESEPPSKPVSDSKIAATLANSGVKVARRTVAKYREAMNIPPSNLRKKLG